MTNEAKIEAIALEPCPFCGGKAERRPDPGVINVPYGLVVEHREGCFLTFKGYETNDRYDAAWNTRAPITTEGMVPRAMPEDVAAMAIVLDNSVITFGGVEQTKLGCKAAAALTSLTSTNAEC